MADSTPHFRDVSSHVDADRLERDVLQYWEDNKIFEQSVEQTNDKPLFTFYDGPPYATGKPHYGHVLQSSIKDTVLRYKTMRGYHVPRRVGWDTHGLPVEVLVEKELGLKTKQDVLEYGIEQFNKKCREVVFRYIDEFTATLKRLGRWADYDNGYATLDRDYMESEWWAFRQLWDKGLVYKDFRSTPYCTRCETPLSNFEVSTNYHDRTDTAVYVKLRVDDHVSSESQEVGNRYAGKLYLLVWTTTPWTLPANVAVAYNPKLTYVTVEQGGDYYLLAQERVAAVFGSDANIDREWSPTDFGQFGYDPIYPKVASSLGKENPPYQLVEGHHVTAEEGTGLVHIAPAFGAEDADVGRQADLPTLSTIKRDGSFDERVPEWGGMNLFDTNELIVKDLSDRKMLLDKEQYTHSYPFCWRCDTPLIYYALDTWFIKISEIKQRMLETNEDITWIPEHIKHGRFAKGIESAPDWAVSRNRFWSVPVPIWECDSCAERVCVGDLNELQTLAGVDDVPDMHRPYVDELAWQCSQCAGTMRRVEEVLDVWFDSGSMPYAQWHYPFENKELVEQGLPADFIGEAIEMTRAWFYTLHVLATAIMDKPAFKNVIGSGIIFGEDGNKLSKKLKNYPEIEPTLEHYGADTLRLFFLNSTLGEPYAFSQHELQQLHRNFYLTLWNVYSFFVRYANTHEWTPKRQVDSDHVLDRWIMARTAQLEYDVTVATDAYHVDRAARAFLAYVDDLSNWYVRRSRQRFQRPVDDAARDAAFSTLHDVLVRVARLAAPFIPFVTEDIFRNLTGETSVHLESLPDAREPTGEQQELLSEMSYVRQSVSEALAARAQAGIKIRQPLQILHLTGDVPRESLAALILDETNVKQLTGGAEATTIDTEITPELKREGQAREVIRHGQQLRRKAGYALDDRITVIVAATDAALKAMLREQHDTIARALQADAIADSGDEDEGADITIDGKALHIGVKRG